MKEKKSRNIDEDKKKKKKKRRKEEKIQTWSETKEKINGMDQEIIEL